MTEDSVSVNTVIIINNRSQWPPGLTMERFRIFRSLGSQVRIPYGGLFPV